MLQKSVNSITILVIFIALLDEVSHTTDDLVFEWEEDVPLDVWKNIELPQLQLEGNYTNDCTQVYATGIMYYVPVKQKIAEMNVVDVKFIKGNIV